MDIEDLLKEMRPITKDGIVSLLHFNSKNVRPLIHEAKFHQNDRAFQLLAEVLKQYLKNMDDKTLIIPIPLSRKRLQERGYNQVEEVVKRAAYMKLCVHILFRERDTKPQTSLSRQGRLENMVGAFACHRHSWSEVAGSNIILIDDVSTTGSTLKAAAEALRPLNPASLTLLSLSR